MKILNKKVIIRKKNNVNFEEENTIDAGGKNKFKKN